MTAKSEFLQIRVTPQQKGRLRRLAGNAGLDVSSYVISRALPPAQQRFEELIGLLRDESEQGYSLAALNDLLAELAADELRDSVVRADLGGLSPLMQNYIAATVEHACVEKDRAPPSWTARVPPLEAPWFATTLRSLHPHLLRASPVAFKRRNLFVDATVGARV